MGYRWSDSLATKKTGISETNAVDKKVVIGATKRGDACVLYDATGKIIWAMILLQFNTIQDLMLKPMVVEQYGLD